MTAAYEYECPVCWRGIRPAGACIKRHTDTIGRDCPMSGQPIDSAIKLNHHDKPRRA